MPGWLIHNGKFFRDDELLLSANNRSFRYGDGIFETLRLSRGRVPLWDLHQQRLFHSLGVLGFQIPKLFTPDFLLHQTQALIKKNNLTNARIRITLYRGNGGLTDKTDQTPGFIIQSWPAESDAVSMNINGLQIGIYNDAKKAEDQFSSLKTNSFLPYVQAALFARDMKWNDALVLNSNNRIADSSIANVYWVKDGRIFTPPVSEGPIAGVMRRYLLENTLIHEQPLTEEELLQADEVFLTNAFRGIQWVAFVGEHALHTNNTAAHLHRDLIVPLFS
jgi:branched-chain amino acid aminotransferase